LISQGYTVFGWKVHHVSVDAGETFDIRVAHETALNRLSAQTLYTKGLITGHYANDLSRSTLVRGPGFATDNLPDPLPALHIKLTAQEPSEWWCLSVPANQSLPSVSFIRLQPSESVEVEAGSLMFICDGSFSIADSQLSGPVAVNVQNTNVVTAGSNAVYGMIFDKVNE
jgi:hypothetical protein